MKNYDFLIGVGIGAVIVCSLTSNKCGQSDENKHRGCEQPYLPPPCDFEFLCPPIDGCKRKKKERCGGCYYEKYERKSCR